MKEDAIADVLRELNQSSPHIEGSLVCADDGATIASVMDRPLDPERIAAIAAALLALAQEGGRLLERGELEQVLTRSSDGYLLLAPAGPHAVLMIVMRSAAKPGLVMMDARRAADAIGALT